MARLKPSPAIASAAAYAVGVAAAFGTMATLARYEDSQLLVAYNLGLSVIMIGGQILSLGFPVGILAYFHETLDGIAATTAARRAANRFSLCSLIPFSVSTAFSTLVGECRLNPLIFLSAALLMAANKILIAGASVSERPEALGFTNMFRFLPHLAGAFAILQFDNLNLVLGPPTLLLIGELTGFLYLRFTIRKTKADCAKPAGHIIRRSLAAWPSVLVLDVNTRIDLLCLGLLGHPNEVVYYGLFVLMADGFLSFFMLGRTTAEPIIAVTHRSRHDAESALNHLVRTSRISPVLATIALGGLLATSQLWSPILLGRPMTKEALVALFVLFSATVIASSGIPFAFCRSILGDPSGQNTTYVAFSLGNLLLNLALIGAIGAVGAAVGTFVGNISYQANKRWVLTHVRRHLAVVPENVSKQAQNVLLDRAAHEDDQQKH